MKVRICYAFAKAFFYNLYITGHNRTYKVAAGNSTDDTQLYSSQRIITAQRWISGNLTRSIMPTGTSKFGSSVDRWASGTDIWSTWLGGGF